MERKNLESLSEDDLRTKIVNQWLKDIGVSDKDINLEYSINLRLGRGIRSIHSRADVLVRNHEGNNLLIIEVKKPTHILQDSDKHQAISYARSLADGGIAPFTILTNGTSTLIFDSVTGFAIGDAIPFDHPAVENQFRATGDFLRARSEALEYLITVNKDNLLAFCKGQVDYRMSLLRSKDPFSNKKYIPQLYVNRSGAEEKLEKKLFDGSENNDIVLVVGPPQHGKTCFMCHSAEVFLKQGRPVLFYPAISLKNGLLMEILEDFQWVFKEDLTYVQLVSRIMSILHDSETPLIIIVDGWNEMNSQAILINNEVQRLNNKNIKVVLSATSPSLSRLLIDEADNLSFIATLINLNINVLKRLSSEPIHNSNGMSIIQIGNFKIKELETAKKFYGDTYNVKFTNNTNLPYNPFYLRIASEQYTNSVIPNFATLTELIGDSLIKKGGRRGIQSIELFNNLNNLAAIALKYDTPFPSTLLTGNLCNSFEFSRWLESGILVCSSQGNIPYVDFYFTHDKNYAIAIVNREWQRTLLCSDESQINEEISLALTTEAGRTALEWFLSVPEYSEGFKTIFANGSYFNTIKNDHLTVFSKAIANQINFNDDLSFDWLDIYIDRLYESGNACHDNIQDISLLIYSLVMSIDRNEQFEKYRLWMRILLKVDNSFDELGIDESYVHKIYGEEIRSDDGFLSFIDGDFDVALFEKFALDDDVVVASRAAIFLAYVCPYYFLEKVPQVANYHATRKLPIEVQDIVSGASSRILWTLREKYFGGMCRGWFTDAELGDDEVATEFYKQKENWRAIVKYLSFDTYLEVNRLLQDLAEYIIFDNEIDQDKVDQNQIKLFFP